MNPARLGLIALILLVVAGCAAPIFRSEGARFEPEPEVIEQLQPYLTDWATTPANLTENARKQLASQMDEVMLIGIHPERTQDNNVVDVVDILLETWGDWNKGYYYVHDGSELAERPGLRLSKVDDHLYIYNRND